MSLRDQMRHELKDLAKLAATMPRAPSAPPTPANPTDPASASSGEAPRDLSSSDRSIPPTVASMPSISSEAAEAQQTRGTDPWRRNLRAGLAISVLAAVVVGGIAVGRLLTFSSAASPATAALPATALPATAALRAPVAVDLDAPLPSSVAQPVVTRPPSGESTATVVTAPMRSHSAAQTSLDGAIPNAVVPATHHAQPLSKAVTSRQPSSPAPTTPSTIAPASAPANGGPAPDLIQQIRAAVQAAKN
jgi:hypothetical protein